MSALMSLRDMWLVICCCCSVFRGKLLAPWMGLSLLLQLKTLIGLSVGLCAGKRPVLLVSELWSSQYFHQLSVLDANTSAVPWLSLAMGTITPCDSAHLELVAHPGLFRMQISAPITMANISRTQGLLDGRRV